MEAVLFPPCAQGPKGLKGEKGDEGEVGTLNCKCGNSAFNRASTPEHGMAAVNTFNVHIERAIKQTLQVLFRFTGIIDNT